MVDLSEGGTREARVGGIDPVLRENNAGDDPMHLHDVDVLRTALAMVQHHGAHALQRA